MHSRDVHGVEQADHWLRGDRVAFPGCPWEECRVQSTKSHRIAGAGCIHGPCCIGLDQEAMRFHRTCTRCREALKVFSEVPGIGSRTFLGCLDLPFVDVERVSPRPEEVCEELQAALAWFE
tara:strand:+ start:292 stop:654 length:363 start_codon:yes stop_codon:yes gene_type:complete